MAEKVLAEANTGSEACWKKIDFTPATILGKGCFGKVKFADHADLGHVAIKELTRRSQWNKDAYLEEFDRMARLRHGHVVHIHGGILEPSYTAVVMEVAEYGSLRILIQRLEQVQMMPMALVMQVIYHVADGMSYLHAQPQSILHGNLKAASVLIFHGWIAKVAGFGLLGSTSCSQGGSGNAKDLVFHLSSGTHHSPELLDSGRKRDVYDFSVFMWWLLCDDPQTREQLEEPACADTDAYDEDSMRSECRRDVVNVMMECWSSNDSTRPTFTEISARMAAILPEYEEEIAHKGSQLTSFMSEHEISDTLADDLQVTSAEPLHTRALRRATPELLEVLRNYCGFVAFKMHSWELLDSPEHFHACPTLSPLQGSKSQAEEEPAAKLIAAIHCKDEFTTLAFLAALSMPGESKRRDEIYLPILSEVKCSDEDETDLAGWSLLLKTDGLSFAESGSWQSKGIINDDDSTVAKVLPTQIQQVQFLMSCLLKSEKAEEEIGTLRQCVLPHAASSTHNRFLPKVSFFKKCCEGSREDADKLSVQALAVGSARSLDQESTKETKVEPQICLHGEFNEKGGSLFLRSKSVKLTVPKNAVKGKQKMSLSINLEKAATVGTFSHEFEFGSTVSDFSKHLRVQLVVPHCAPKNMQLIVAVRSMGSDEFVPSDMDVSTDDIEATIFLSQPCRITLIGQPYLSRDRHWWLLSRTRVPLYIFGYLYPNTGVARIYYAYMYEDLCEKTSLNELTSGGRYVQSQRLQFMFCPENGALIFEEESAGTNPMTHPVPSILEMSYGCITLPMKAATGKVKVYQELGSGGVLVFGDESALPERLPSSAAGQTISTFEMETLASKSLPEEVSTIPKEIASEDESTIQSTSRTAASEQDNFGTHEAESKRDELRFGSAIGKFMAPLWCRDIGVSAAGTALLGAGWDGLKEYDGSGKEVSSWTTKTDLGYSEWVPAIDAAADGRVAVGLWYSRSVALLRRNPDDSREWIEDRRVKDLEIDPWRVSVYRDFLAVAEGVPRNKLALFNISRTRKLHATRQLDYSIQCLIVTEKAVIMASLGKVKVTDPSGETREKYVVDGCSHLGDPLWRHDSDEKAWDICSSPSGQVVYLALHDSNKVKAISAVDGLHLVDVVTNDQHGLEVAWRLSMSTGPRFVLGVISYQVRKGR